MNRNFELPNLRHLRMVQVIGQSGGVSCASRELNTSQPAVTQAVANLESDLGAAIFERRATGTYATPTGEKFLVRIARIFEILEAAIHPLFARDEQTLNRDLPKIERILTVRQLRSMIVTSQSGRVAELAEQLELSPASLFRSARTLERSLEKDLFDRSANGPIPNKLGSLLAREFQRAVREYEMARGEILLEAGAENLELVIGALPMSGSYELAETIRIFMEQSPAAKVRVVTGTYNKLLNDLLNCQIDMIFGTLQKPEWAQDVSEEHLFHDSYCVVTRPGHPLSKLDEITADDLRKFDWVAPAKGTPRRKRIDALFDGVEEKPRFRFETSSLSTSRALLLRSDTVTVMTRSEVQLDASLGVMESLPCSRLDMALPKGATVRCDWLPTAAHEMFLNCLRSVTAATEHEH